MLAYYKSKIELSDDDVLSIQNFYDNPTNTTLISPLQPAKEKINI